MLKYFSAYIFIVLGYFSLTGSGWMTFSLLLFSFVVVPIVELVTPERKSSNEVKNSVIYDIVLFSLIPVYFALLVIFLMTISKEMTIWERIGKISAMGILCGIYGINLAHELGHRKGKAHQFFAQLLLWSSQYMHFFIEHNRGHHKRIGTPQDPATARKGEGIYRFWLRTVIGSYRSALELEKERLKRNGLPAFSWKNGMVRYALFQIMLILLIVIGFGLATLMYYLIAALIGILLLETINYIEHYGLMRSKISASAYERVQDIHSWNSDYILGRILLFELTRHSHHHANSSIPYSGLESRPKASQLPTGYPGMMILSLVPPLWFKVMNPRLDGA